MKTWMRWAALVFGLSLTGLLPGAGRCAATSEDAAEPVDPEVLDRRDREIDQQQLRQIYDAIQAYRRKHGQLPGWLSDLFPEFLSDPRVLVSPAEARKGPPQTWGYGEPKMRCSYLYEFSQAEAGGRRDRGVKLTMRQWKEIQMEEFGPVTPILRCHLHDPVLNVSYSGELYETQLFWEQDPNTLALMRTLGPGPGAKDGVTLDVIVLDADTGKPLAGCQVLVTNRASELGALPPRTLETDAQGRCTANLGGRSPTAATLRVTKSGFASGGMDWAQGEPQTAWTVRLPRSRVVGGVVRSAAGQPIADVHVAIQGIMQDAVGQVVPLEYDVVTTDAAGRWQSERVPQGTNVLSFKLSHEEYQPREFDVDDAAEAGDATVRSEDLIGLKAEMRLEPGFVVEGKVVKPDGAPFAGAQVVVATGENLENRKTQRTRADGRFRLVLIEPAEGHVLVQARGHVPQQQALTVDRDLKPLEFQMAPSRVVRGRVVDGEGNPVPGATVALAAMEQASLLDWNTTADPEGRFQCDTVPKGGYAFYANKVGYGTQAMQEVQSLPDGELVLRLEISFQITGRVVDAETQQPLSSFTVVPGRVWGGAGGPDAMVYWETFREQRGTEGVFTMVFEEQGESQYRLLVFAEGYLPEMTPLLSGRGRRTNDFALRKGQGPEGIVVGPDGQPVAGAQVATLGLGYLSLAGARIEAPGGERSGLTATDAQGRFRLPAILVAPTLVAVHELGYGEINATNLVPGGRIALRKWGKVEGVLKFGSRPAADEEVALSSVGHGHLQYSHETFKTTTQSDGRFSFETVPPGPRQLVRLIRMNERSWMHSQPQMIDVREGEVTEVQYGGKGRPVIGQFVLSGSEATDVDWNTGHHALSTRLPQPPRSFQSPEEAQQWQTSPEFQEALKHMRSYGFRIQPDGAFRIEGVEAGRYTLQMHLQQPIGDGLMGGPVLGHLATEVEVPEIPTGVSDDPLDLGKLQLQAQRRNRP